MDAVGDAPKENARLGLRLYWASNYFSHLGNLLGMAYTHITKAGSDPVGKDGNQDVPTLSFTSDMHSVRTAIRDSFIPHAVIKVSADAGLPLKLMLPDENEELVFYNNLTALIEHVAAFLRGKNELYSAVPNSVDMNKFVICLQALRQGGKSGILQNETERPLAALQDDLAGDNKEMMRKYINLFCMI